MVANHLQAPDLYTRYRRTKGWVSPFWTLPLRSRMQKITPETAPVIVGETSAWKPVSDAVSISTLSFMKPNRSIRKSLRVISVIETLPFMSSRWTMASWSCCICFGHIQDHSSASSHHNQWRFLFKWQKYLKVPCAYWCELRVWCIRPVPCSAISLWAEWPQSGNLNGQPVQTVG